MNMIAIIIKHIFAYFVELWKNKEESVQVLALLVSSGASERKPSGRIAGAKVGGCGIYQNSM